MANLAIAFPEKSLQEQKRIAARFYRGFVDTFIETIKVLSLSDAAFDRRCTGDFSSINQLAVMGRNIQMMGGHQFNWEYANLYFARNIGIPFLGVIAPVENKAIDRLFLKLRAKYGTILIPNNGFQRQMTELMKKQYSLCIAADQSTFPEKGYWLNFLGKPAPFAMGPHRASIKYKPVLVYFSFYKIKRGYYHFEVYEIIENPGEYTPESLAIQYRDFLEVIIRNQPENYLWSHRRWKHPYKESYRKQWIDT